MKEDVFFFYLKKRIVDGKVVEDEREGILPLYVFFDLDKKKVVQNEN